MKLANIYQRIKTGLLKRKYIGEYVYTGIRDLSILVPGAATQIRKKSASLITAMSRVRVLALEDISNSMLHIINSLLAELSNFKYQKIKCILFLSSLVISISDTARQRTSVLYPCT